MRKSIRKTLSLCLAMAMILSVLGIPAFAEMRVVHIHSYDTELSSYEEYEYVNNQYHRLDVTRLMACDCGECTVFWDSYNQPHVPAGSGSGSSGGNTEGDVDIYFTCKFCGHTYHS